jgi:hypothetical protein
LLSHPHPSERLLPTRPLAIPHSTPPISTTTDVPLQYPAFLCPNSPLPRPPLSTSPLLSASPALHTLLSTPHSHSFLLPRYGRGCAILPDCWGGERSGRWPFCGFKLDILLILKQGS